MVQFRIPDLLSCLPACIKATNADNDILQAGLVEVIDQCHLTDHYKKDLKRAEIPHLAIRAFPGSDLKYLRICVEYLIAAFLLDRLTDKPATAAQAQEWADIYKQDFRKTLQETKGPARINQYLTKKCDIYPQAFSKTFEKTKGPAEIIKYLTSHMSNTIKDPYWSCLVENNILLADGMAKEAVDRENPGTEMDLETYIKVRRDTIGARQLFDLGRWIHELNITPETLTHPDIVRMEEQFIDLISLANDLYSYKKEYLAKDAKHNYLTIALRDPTADLHENDLQGAINYTYDKFCRVLADLEHQKKVLPRFGKSEEAKVDKYFWLMMNVVIGTIQWSLECERYGHFVDADGPNQGDVVFNL
ncbi:hypothetical protein E4T56_gene4911 [Termitomyces sp. T112]|nr:hypothetical protein E4T56_gene4911 [Termitomyces sp. T112]